MSPTASNKTQIVRAEVHTFSSERGGLAVASSFDQKIYIAPKLTSVHFKRGDVIELEVDASQDKPRAVRILGCEPTTFVTATVKHYDGQKDFGFVTLPNKRNVFVHAKTLRRHNIEARALQPGAAIEVAYANTPRGYHATALRLV